MPVWRIILTALFDSACCRAGKTAEEQTEAFIPVHQLVFTISPVPAPTPPRMVHRVHLLHAAK